MLFLRLAGVEMVHVPYKGGAPAVQSVLAGDTQLSFATPPSVLPLVQAGRLRALAVTSRERTPLVPGVPGMAEAGLPDYEISFWYGFFVPAGTPAEVVRKLFDATSQALKLPEIARMLAREGTETSGSTSPEDFAAFLAEDAKLWERIVKEGERQSRLTRAASARMVSMLPPSLMQAVNSSSAKFWLVGGLLAVGRLEDFLHQLPAAVGLRHVVDARHDGARLRALHLLFRERARHHRHVGGDAAFHRALRLRRRAGAADGDGSSNTANSLFMKSPERGARSHGRPESSYTVATASACSACDPARCCRS